MKKKILFSASLFHSINDAASVIIPMIFPLLYNQQFIIKRYSHIGIISNLGLLATFVFQIVIANVAYKFEYKHLLVFSVLGISVSLFLTTLSWTFFSLLLFYLLFRFSVSFYHPLGISMVSKSHPDRAIDFAMGIQSGSGNLGVLVAFLLAGSLAQNFGWKAPLLVWAVASLVLGSISYFSVRKNTSRNEGATQIHLSSWLEALTESKKYILGFVFGGACWGTTIYYAPSLLNHKFHIPLTNTGVYLAFWIATGTLMTYFFGYLSRRFGRWRLSLVGFIGSTFSLIMLGIAPVMELAVLSLLFFGTFLFLTYPAFQSYIGNEVQAHNQVLAFSLVANIQILSGAVVVFISGFLSDKFGINSPFLVIAGMGVAVSAYYILMCQAPNKT